MQQLLDAFERPPEKPIPQARRSDNHRSRTQKIAAATRHMNTLCYAVANDDAVVRDKLLGAMHD